MSEKKTPCAACAETDPIRAELFSMRDPGYRVFQAKLVPTVDPERIIGVRTPDLRDLAKRIAAGGADLRTGAGAEAPGLRERFRKELPHFYFEEDQLHAFLIALERDPARCLDETEAFLPFIDNWATCDQLNPRAFRKSPDILLPRIRGWIASERTYTVRFAVKMLMDHFLEERFLPAYPQAVASIRSDEYYVNMMAAWYFATALAKQWDAVLPYLAERRLPEWTHRKTIQKAVESFRIPKERKEYLRALR